MAEIPTFEKHVPDVRQNTSIPTTERHVTAEPGSIPDFQGVTENLAESQNNLSVIGAKVAQSASNQMASQLGYSEGKTPHGDLMPSITEFDKNFADSYHQQANATLSIQGQKLLDDAHVEMSKPNRLSPDLITRTTQQLQLGLNKIAEQAPTAIKGKLQESFDSQVLTQTSQYKEKMFGQQREDESNNLKNGISLATQNAYELYTKGDKKGGDLSINSAISMAKSGGNSKYFTPEEERTYRETAIQTGLNGQFINQAQQAEKEGKLPEFEKQFADKKLPGMEGMTNIQHIATGQAIATQMNFLQSLRSQDENLKSQQMLNSIASNPGDITGTQWQSFADSVSPLKAEEVKFKYIQALKAHQTSTVNMDNLLANFSNPEVFANSTEKTQNAAFNKGVNYTIQQGQQSGNSITQDQAEVQVAASAGGKVPVFIDTLKNKLHSANPMFIESAAQQIHTLESMGAGHALVGLTDQDKALYTTYESMRDSRDPVTAARDATDAVLNQDPEVQQANKQKWSNILTQSTQGGVSITDYALTQFGMNQQSFINPSMATIYGADILKKYSTFYQLTNGDTNNAKQLTQKYIDQNYGDTGINGGSYKTLHPLEKTLGFKDNSGTPYIQQDVINQVNEKFIPIKKMFDDKKSNEYWQTMPLTAKQHGIFKTTYDPVQVKRFTRTSDGKVKSDTFNLVLQGNAFDNWDVAIQGESGMRNLFQIAPYLGIIGYKPNTKAIKDSFNKDHPLN